MKLKFVLITLFICAIGIAQNKGTVSGTLFDKESKNQPLPFANVVIKGTSIGVNTDIDGKYSINLPAGNYIIQFSFVGYENVETPVTIKANETIVINKTLGSGSYTLKDVVVKASGNREKETVLLYDQKKAVVIKQSIGAQEMARKGVSDVEEGLTKVTGITKVDGRGLFVRGLEDRYNNLLINDLAVPSNNPFKKIIPLDIFPTDIVSVIDTYKTFNTNIYGDFAGGTFNIATSKGTKSQSKINFGIGYTSNNNLRKFLTSKDATSTADFFGFSGTERDFPAIFGNVPSNRVLTASEASTQFGSGFDVKQTNSPLNTSFGILNSEKFSVGKNGNSLQYLVSFNFDNKFQYREGADRFFNAAQGNYDNDLFNKQYKYITNSSALVSLNFKSDRLNLTSNTFYLKSTENMIQDQIGYTNSATINNNGFIRMNQLTQSDFLNTQLLGSYKVSKDDRKNIKAGISFTKTGFQLPDRKSFKGVLLDDNTTAISYSGNSLYRQTMDVDGKFHVSGMMEYTWNFGKKELKEAHKLTIGYNSYINRMDSKFRFLVSERVGSNAVSFNTNSPDATLTNEITNGNFTYREGTNSTYKAKLLEYLNAGYTDVALKFSDVYEMNFGIRFEQSLRLTKYRNPGSFNDPYQKKSVDNLDILPSLNMKYKFNDMSNLRFAASKTITRPVIMEAYPLEFVNLDGTIENGNPNIINSNNYNFDLKYEIFPTAKELVAITAFSKLIQNPIERLFTQSAGSGGQIITYDNSKKALLVGAELELLLQLDRISDTFKNLSFGFNTSLMYSKVTINKSNTTETNPNRRLQGASPWLVNADLKYDFDFSSNWNNSVSLVYNVYGKRIFAVGTNGLDHYYEQPFNKLDLIWSNKIGKKWDAKFSVDNILNPKYSIKLGEKSKLPITESDLTIKDFTRGVGFSLNVAYTF
ncbi:MULTISPECIES: TonB-dependent receptor [Flavobacterium]|uniref:TonB-dependent receptor n=1 Tax=Flavobacterium keumense TaxID=1306518 RepID=A0ABY8N6U7_9FLAO|nr:MULTISPECIES: TonB-dependent receptor [Flavobacterium]WGK94964.1 TonB-dependent receptor [Flavobacterium keumense]